MLPTHALPMETSRPRPGVTSRLRRVVWELRTEGVGPAREAAAIGLGVFIGCSPLYGFHLLLCRGGRMVPWAEPPEDVSRGEHLEPVRGAASASDGASDRRMVQARPAARAHPRHRQEHRPLELRRRSHRRQPRRRRRAWGPERNRHVSSWPVRATTIRWFVALVRRAADRYVSTSITAWEFARGKLRGDPLYRTVLTECAASFGRDARRRRLRAGADACAARRVRSGVARGDLAVILAAASGVRPARRHRNTAVASRRSPARRSARPRRSSKVMRARTCRTDRASCCSSTFFT